MTDKCLSCTKISLGKINHDCNLCCELWNGQAGYQSYYEAMEMKKESVIDTPMFTFKAPDMPDMPNFPDGVFMLNAEQNPGAARKAETEKQKDPGAHYRHTYRGKLSKKDIENGFVDVQLDPARIAKVYGGMTGMQFTILKKCLRMGASIKSKEQDLLDIIGAAQRELELIREDGQCSDQN